ncbi:MAG: MATE family efflux transporter [Lachnospiraceae bacterium]
MQKNMTQGTPLKLIASFSGPMILGNLFQQFYNMVDAIIVGQYVGSNALASVGITGSTTFLMIALMTGLTNGASIMISQAFGSRSYSYMRTIISNLVVVLFILSIALSLIGVVLSPFLLHLLDTPDVLLNDSLAYMQIYFSGILGLAAYNVASAVLRSIGDSKTPLYALILSTILNIGLDLIFVVIFKLGVAGAALATIIAQFGSAIFCILYMKQKHVLLHITKNEFHFQIDIFKKILQLGLPSAFQSSLIALGGMCVQSLINGCGAVTVAGYTAANKLDSLAIQPIVSVGTAMSIYTGQNIGAGQVDRIKTGLKHTLLLMLSGCIVIAAFIVTFRIPLLRLFLNGPHVEEEIAVGSTYLCIVSVAYLIAGIMQSFQNTIRGAGDVNAALIAGIIELSTRVAFSYLLIHNFGPTGLWIAIPLSWGSACTYVIIRYFSGKWKQKSIM